ncbi:hypothetical protein G8770_15925 [Aestuariicella hydrocarbonica]|uniref:Uncharacterized protein n=1 Tax=Pseudomaricurvus hydrocarbonicus TaxID=1470433 RepID=A0A9E5T3J2_9GAMM|nr:hypothetical protein [Aestuariicella hydrocarbonica]
MLDKNRPRTPPSAAATRKLLVSAKLDEPSSQKGLSNDVSLCQLCQLKPHTVHPYHSPVSKMQEASLVRSTKIFASEGAPEVVRFALRRETFDGIVVAMAGRA